MKVNTASPLNTFQENLVNKVPEILSPAGNWECAKAAIENGADAIYFGLDQFNARMRADNFSLNELPELMDYLHERGVRGYVTFNTLVFPGEIDEAKTFLIKIIESRVDAVIVQDVGICRLIRSISKNFPIHVSTQMTVTSAAGINFANDLEAQLVVVARENSIEDIQKIQSQLDEDSKLPLETFVHGALCVAYSGQCLTSEALGGRSANRGECAQACRMQYKLVVDDKEMDLGTKQYLLSPQDLSGLEMIPDLIKAGIHSFKIEGRLKSPEYVANITRAYRQGLDKAIGKQATEEPLSEDSNYAVEMAFSRGLYSGWLKGIDNQKLVHAQYAKKRGVLLGQVKYVKGSNIWVQLKSGVTVKPGDGLVFESYQMGKETEQGGSVYEILEKDDLTRLRFGTDKRGASLIDFDHIRAGAKLWKTRDPALDKKVRSTFAGEKIRYRRPIDFYVQGEPGAKLLVKAYDPFSNQSVELHSSMELIEAREKPLNQEIIARQLGRLGQTPFNLRTAECHLVGQCMLPVSELNNLRRRIVSELIDKRLDLNQWDLDSSSVINERVSHSGIEGNSKHIEWCALIRLESQLEPVVSRGVDRIYCDFEDPKKYRDVVSRFRQICPDGRIFVAAPRIHKPGEEWILKIVKSSEPDGFLIRNYDHLSYFTDGERIGDFSLNIANSLSASFFLHKHSLSRVTVSYDLNCDQVIDLAQTMDPSLLEVTIHQRMPMFHMEHCVFCAFLSSGKDYRDCGRPCEKHQVAMVDRVGEKHYLKADAGCRNTLYNSRLQTGAENFDELRLEGISKYRIEFLNETLEEVDKILDAYFQLEKGEITGEELWRILKIQSKLGVTRGQFNHPDSNPWENK